ncbi:MAG: response regulator [Planctomycetota bacterium]|nr:MAG: response regulator [Planctomycetota bacterium]
MNQPPPTPAAASAALAPKVHVLCVDDEPAVLDGLALHLRRRCTVHLAASAAAGLVLLRREPQIAVVISDMRMPGMDGAAFLAQARVIAPAAVRILLTGQAELSSAVTAVNEGQLFRFLTKPCPPPALLATVEAAAEQHRLITAEKVLLEQTLRGSVQALTDVLALTNPACFGRATRIRQIVGELTAGLALPDAWQVEMAAMLSQLGGIILPPETAERVCNGQQLSDDESRMLARVPEVTEQLLAKIPRLEGVRAILAAQSGSVHGGRAGRPAPKELAPAARVLALATDFDDLEIQGHPGEMAISILRGRKDQYDAAALDALDAARGGSARQVVREVPVAGLRVGMVLADDLRLLDGALILARGYEITVSSLVRLRNFEKRVREPVRVQLPPPQAQSAPTAHPHAA